MLKFKFYRILLKYTLIDPSLLDRDDYPSAFLV